MWVSRRFPFLESIASLLDPVSSCKEKMGIKRGCEAYQLRNWSVRLLLIGLFISVGCIGQSAKYERTLEGCKKLQLGDTEQIVRALIGEPLNIHSENGNLGKGRALEYWAPAIVASSPSIHIDESGHVDSISCHESHHLRKD